MFDRSPDPVLVADLVAAQAAPVLTCPDRAAVDLIEQAMAWERVAAWVESQRLDTLRRFEAARIAADTTLGADTAGADQPVGVRVALRRLKATLATEAGKFAAEEIALALNISPTTAHKQLHLARDLYHIHRDLREALELGQVSGFVASMIAQTTRRLPDPARRLIDEAVTADAVEQPAGRAIAAAKARVSQTDDDADQAARRARDARRLFLKPMDDGQALIGAVLSADDALRVYDRCDAIARQQRRAGADETLDQLRCDTFTSIMLDEASATVAGQPPAQQPANRPVSVSVVIALSTLLGLDSQSGWLDGYGTISAGTAHHLIATGDPTLTRLLCDPTTGATLMTDPTTYKPTAALTHTINCRDRRCRMPGCEARIRHLDHIQAKIDAGLTTTDNLHGLCERSHLAKHHPGWTVTGNADTAVTWQTPTGHHYTSRPPPATGYGTGPPGELDTPDAPAWASQHQYRRREAA